MQATEKIWMNGELVDWADAKIHVASHGLNYGSGVFEGIRCYDTPKGPRCSGSRTTSYASRTRRRCCTWISRTRSRRSARRARGDRGQRLASCYLRPIAFYGYGELGVASTGNPVDVVIISFPWGAYLGEDSQTSGITAKISSWERVGPNVIPHVAKATGIYLNSMLATMEARRGGYDEAIMLSHDGYVADGPGENIFVVKDGVLYTPPLAMSILPGITRDTIIQIAQDLGHRVEETLLIRTDLYLADEVFMVGTATEVAPVRSVDDREIGVGPVTRELQEAYLDTVHGPQRALEPLARRGRDVALRGVGVAAVRTIGLSSPWLDEREEELVADVLRSGRLSLGPTIDRFEEAFAERSGRAVRGGRVERHGRPASPVHRRGGRPGRRGRHLAVLVRRVGELRDLRGRDAGLRGHRPADAEPLAGGGRGGDHGSHARGRRGRHLRLSVRARRARACATPRRRADPGRVRGARRALQGRAGRARRGPSAVFAFYPNKQITTGEGGMVTTHSEESGVCCRSLRNQGRADSGGWLEHARSASTTASTTSAPRSGSASSRSSTRSSQAPRGRARYALAPRGDPGARASRARTTRTTSARGSSTSSRFRPARIARP